MKALFTILFVAFILPPIHSQDTINVPADYSTIQAGIDAAVNGDIVLVAEDTYYENINFKGKAVTVASYFLFDLNEDHIENTIINGSQPSHPDSGSVVYFVSGEDTTSILCGFTITGGEGTYTAQYDDLTGGGILLDLSGGKICNNIIEYNSVSYNNFSHGGGIFAYLDSPSLIIENNIIRNNTTDANVGAIGGGISIWSNNYVRIVNNEIVDNSATCSDNAWGGGINCNGASNQFFITSNYIKGNECLTNNSGGGGGISVYNGTPVSMNNLIVENSTLRGGGVIIESGTNTSSPSSNAIQGRFLQNINGLNSTEINSKQTQSEPTFENNTIVNNIATQFGGGMFFGVGIPVLMNCILWDNTAISGSQISGTADVQYSDVEGGYIGTGNIDENPQFELGHPYYTLLSNSPCINTGNSNALYNDLEDPNNPGNPWWPAQGTLANDMGHCGGPNSLWQYWEWPVPVEDKTPTVVGFKLNQNYPNPFNPTTMIKYAIPERSFVELKVFDILGREVASLVNEEQDAGYYEFNFNAVKLSSGIYFYRIKADDFVQTKKMILIK